MKTPDTIAMKTTPMYTTTRIGMLFSAILLLGGILAIMAPRAQAQIGPGGGGNASGADGQPANLLWLRGDALTGLNDGDPIASWGDVSGNANDAEQPEAGQRPTFRTNVLNGYPVLRFEDPNEDENTEDGFGDFLDTPNLGIGATSGYTYFIVLDAVPDVTGDDVDNGQGTFFLDRPTAVAPLVSLKAIDDGGVKRFGYQTRYNDGSGLDAIVSSTQINESAGAPHLAVMQRDVGSEFRFFVDGNEEGTLSDDGQDLEPPLLRIGSHAIADAMDGDIAEVIVFEKTLNEAERIIVQTYLSAKYANWIGGDEILVYNYSTNYFESFAGIGRIADDTQHTAAQSDELQLQNPTTLDDDDFVLFGHNNAPYSFTTSGAPESAQRVEREWRFDLKETSTQTVDVDLDVSTLSLPGATDGYGLLVNSSNDFSSGATFYPVDSNGQASDVELNNGDFLTVVAVERTLQFSTDNIIVREDAGGDNLGDAFAPALDVELNYPTLDPVSGIEFSVEAVTSTLVEDETTVAGRDHPDYRGVSSGISPDPVVSFTFPASTAAPFDFNPNVDNETDSALEVVNDSRDPVNHPGDQSALEDLKVTLQSVPSGISLGSRTELIVTIQDDDDPRRASFSGFDGETDKPLRNVSENPEESLSGATEADEPTLTFEVALPEGVEGSSATFVRFEVTGVDTEDFTIPAIDDGTIDQEPITDRRGRAVVNTIEQVDGEDTGYGRFQIEVNDTGVFKGDRDLTVELIAVESGTTDQQGRLSLDYTILEADAPPQVSFVTDTDSGTEDDSPAVATLQLDNVASTDITVDLDIEGSAEQSTDYLQTFTTPVTIPAGQDRLDLEFSIIDRNDLQPARTITVEVEDTNVDIGTPDNFTYTIFTNQTLGSTGPGGVGDETSNAIWLRADAFDTLDDNDPVDVWNDVSGNSRDAGQTEASQRPTLKTGIINGLPAVRFEDENGNIEDGFGDFLDTPSPDIPATSGYTYLMVLDVVPDVTGDDVDSGQGTFFLDRPAEASPLVSLKAIDDGGDNYFGYQTRYDDDSGLDAIIASTEINVSPGTPRLALMQRDVGNEFSLFIDGNQEGDLDDDGRNLTPPPLRIGSHAKEDAMDGDIAEVIVFNTGLNVTQRTIVQNYLAAKYDISLEGSDVYSGDTDTNGNYDYGVFGVGQESDTDFHPAAETDGLRFDNVFGLGDNDYLLAGYAELNNTVNTSDVGGVADLEARMERDWFWDSNGSSPTVDVTFNLSETGFSSVLNPDPSGYVLLYRSGQDGDWTEVSSSAAVDNGDEITFAGVSVSSNGYYTLGTTEPSISPISGTAITIVGTAGNEGSAADGSLGGDAGWRMVGPPVSGATVGNIISDVRNPFILNQITQGDQLFRWDDTIDNGNDPNGGWEVLREAGDPFDSGRGHILFFFDDDEGPIAPTLTIDVDAGTVPDPETDQTVTVNQNAQWHLLANPFNQAYDLNSLESNGGTSLSSGGTDFQTTVQIWDGGSTGGERGSTAGGYETINLSSASTNLAADGRVISAWQGFFVERETHGTGDTQFTFNSAGTTSADRSIVGSNAEGPGFEVLTARIGLEMTVADESGTQVARDAAASITWHENATEGWDVFDATKLTPLTAAYATIAPVGPTRDGTAALKAQESRPWPQSEDVITVPLDLEIAGGIAGTATLVSHAWQDVPPEWELTLIDTKGTADPSDDEAIAWTEEATYSFTLDADASSSTRASEDATRTQAQKSGLRPPRPEALDAQRPESMLSGYEDDESKTDNADGSTSGASSEAQTSNEDTPPRFVMEVDPQGAPLPVELQELTVQQHDQRALLEWTTASETNNAGFYVETQPLSADSTTTESDWTDLGFVEGTGTTDTPQSYQFETDALDYGAHAFRLRQVDTDGTETATDPVTIEVQLDDAYAIDAPYPNPSNEQATLPVTVQETQRVQVMLYDMLGRRIATVHDGEIRGQDTQAIQLDTGRLASGTYFVRVRGKDFTATERVTVVR